MPDFPQPPLSGSADRASPRQPGLVVWFTGLSGSGKTTLARAVEADLLAQGRPCYVLDGDLLRQGLCRDLGLSAFDRQENIRRAGEVAALFADAGLIALVALISPYAASRAQARAAAPAGRFIEVHVATPLAVCEQRDPKGLYRRFRAGQMTGLTGCDAPYEEPERPELRLDTMCQTLTECKARNLSIIDTTSESRVQHLVQSINLELITLSNRPSRERSNIMPRTLSTGRFMDYPGNIK